jgi:hypothetical protein
MLATLEVAGSSTLGSTVTRTHLVLQIPSGTANQSSLRIGLIIGRVTDVGINVAGQPQASQPELDWMFLERYYPTFSGATQDSTCVFRLDLKAQRQVREQGLTYLLCMTNVTASASTINIWARTLLRLP